ncbi:MAG: copper-translocating P-type ATPase, partial [Clostridia bacterium]|nr:copper-translocating P-type ATPase [Clostridia bacterium]
IPVLFLGRRFFTSGFGALLHGSPNMDTLVALSSTASFLYSLVMTFRMSDAPHLVHQLYFESAAVVVALVSVGKYLEARSKEKTRGAIQKLMELAPDTALLVDESGQREVPASTVKAGDTLLVKPGARVPLDGVVVSGAGSVNEAMLTGESMPVEKAEGSEVIGGSVSLDGALYVRVTRVGEDTTLAGIIRFVEDAQGKKAPISKTADRVAGIFVPAVMAVALLAAAAWLFAGESFAFALNIFTSVLVIACPCAMGLATPTAIIVGTGLGASRGILVRSGEALEITHRVSLVIFDKTGTITEGRPDVTDVVAGDEAAFLRTAYALEKLSDHPLAGAICRAAEARGVGAPEPLTAFESVGGRGLRALDAGGRALLAGNEAFLTENGVSVADYAAALESLRAEGKTIVLAARDGRALGFAAIADAVKPGAREALEALRQAGVKTVMLTGDNRAAAGYTGAQVGIGEVVSEVLPTEKAGVVEAYQAKGETVMMVGDGINDAPALVQADIGCAIGSGSDIAIDSADLVLMRSDLMDVSRALRLSRLTVRNIRQNLFWAFCYNTLGIPIAAGALYPALNLLLSPMIGGIAMSLSSLFVVTNALRLKGKKL